MKKLNILLFVVTLFIFGCDNEKKELMAEYNSFVNKSDSIEMAHKNFEEIHNKMLIAHDKFAEELNAMETPDSSIIENIAEHGMMLERHDAILKSHKKIIDTHKNDKPNFDEMSGLELKEKIEEMKQWHEQMMKDHEQMEEEHKSMQDEYAAIKESLNMTKKEDS